MTKQFYLYENQPATETKNREWAFNSSSSAMLSEQELAEEFSVSGLQVLRRRHFFFSRYYTESKGKRKAGILLKPKEKYLYFVVSNIIVETEPNVTLDPLRYLLDKAIPELQNQDFVKRSQQAVQALEQCAEELGSLQFHADAFSEENYFSESYWRFLQEDEETRKQRSYLSCSVSPTHREKLESRGWLCYHQSNKNPPPPIISLIEAPTPQTRVGTGAQTDTPDTATTQAKDTPQAQVAPSFVQDVTPVSEPALAKTLESWEKSFFEKLAAQQPQSSIAEPVLHGISEEQLNNKHKALQEDIEQLDTKLRNFSETITAEFKAFRPPRQRGESESTDKDVPPQPSSGSALSTLGLLLAVVLICLAGLGGYLWGSGTPNPSTRPPSTEELERFKKFMPIAKSIAKSVSAIENHAAKLGLLTTRGQKKRKTPSILDSIKEVSKQLVDLRTAALDIPDKPKRLKILQAEVQSANGTVNALGTKLEKFNIENFSKKLTALNTAADSSKTQHLEQLSKKLEALVQLLDGTAKPKPKRRKGRHSQGLVASTTEVLANIKKIIEPEKKADLGKINKLLDTTKTYASSAKKSLNKIVVNRSEHGIYASLQQFTAPKSPFKKLVKGVTELRGFITPPISASSPMSVLLSALNKASTDTNTLSKGLGQSKDALKKAQTTLAGIKTLLLPQNGRCPQSRLRIRGGRKAKRYRSQSTTASSLLCATAALQSETSATMGLFQGKKGLLKRLEEANQKASSAFKETEKIRNLFLRSSPKKRSHPK